MKNLLPFIVRGLATGSVYAMAGMGLVVTYKTSGIFNFAHGAVGTVAAYAFYELHIRQSVPWPIAALAAVLLVGVGGGLGLERLAASLAGAEVAYKVVATIGIVVAVQGLAVSVYGSAARDVPRYLGSGTFRLLGTHVGYDQVILFVLAATAALGLSLFFRSSRLGIAMRGVVDDAPLLALTRTSPRRVRLSAWILGSSLAAISGILLVPSIGLDAILLTLLVVQAFGAAAVGAFSSLPLTYVGGLLVGVGQALLTKGTASSSILSGIPPSFPFIVLFIALLIMPKNRLVSEPRRLGTKGLSASHSASRDTLRYGLLLLALVILPFVVGDRVPLWTQALVYAVIFASLNLLVRTSGQVSLCHVAFVAVGASTFANLTHGLGLPWLLALVISGLVAVPIGAVVAVPAIRLSGVYLAAATFGFGILVQRVVYPTALMFGLNGERTATRPAGLSGDRSFYFIILAVVAACLLLVIIVHRTRFGRLLRALAGSPVILETYGTSVRTTLLISFCLSAFLASVAGALLASTVGAVNSYTFDSFSSLIWLAVLLLAGRDPIASGLIAAILLVVVPGYVQNSVMLDYEPVAFGLGAVLMAVVLARGYVFQARTPQSRLARSEHRVGRGRLAIRRALAA